MIPFASAYSNSWESLSNPIIYIIATTALLLIMTSLTFSRKKIHKKTKRWFFWLMVIPIILSSLYLAAHTVYDNITSVTHGPVHWHADYEVWACGEKLDLTDPGGLSNKIGTPLLHEHNDNRIHVEGVVKRFEDINLGNFFNVIGGKLMSDHLSYPTNNGLLMYKNGDSCGNVPGILKVFVNGKRISDPANYVIAPSTFVPPGDCIVIDFSPGDLPQTDYLCTSWKTKGVSYGG